MAKKASKKKLSSKRNINDIITEIRYEDYDFVVPLAAKIRAHAPLISKYISSVISEIAVQPFSKENNFSRFKVLKTMTQILFPKSEGALHHIEKSFRSLQETFSEISTDVLKNTQITSELVSALIEGSCSAVEQNPRLIALFRSPEILEEAFGSFGERLASLLNLIPVLSHQAAENFPELKETLFNCLFLLSKEERLQIYSLAEEIMKDVYTKRVFPLLQESLSSDPRGLVLAPILLGAIEAIPGESCINAVLSIACTPQREFSNGRVIAIAIQEIGGLYVKMAQVISEICPPSLARELRTTQDDAGGIFPGIERSWEYFLSTLNEAEYEPIRPFLLIPSKPIRHFASASVGALYLIGLNEAGKEKFKVESLLIKLQRPNLRELFEQQCNHIVKMTDQTKELLEKDSKLSLDVKDELNALIATLRRAVLNYYRQSQEELNFNIEEKNAEKVREALGENHFIKVPRFFFSTEKAVFMECIKGTKVTKIIQTKYLERREIADSIAEAFIDLVFQKGVVWADPHAGNILFDHDKMQIAMIDLNPCYVWDDKTRQEFKHLIYRLIFRDPAGVFRSLFYLVEDSNSLDQNILINALNKFFDTANSNPSLSRFVGEFIRTLSEHNVDLKTEVQAALRGLSQLAITTSSISVRNSFGTLLRKQFAFKEILRTVWNVGVFRVFQVFFSMVFELIRVMPEDDVGPVLDERDLSAIYKRTIALSKANVCDVIVRRVSPEDHTGLKLSQDSQTLLVTSSLTMEILDKVRPARVKYVIDIPSRRWLKDRQEFVKLSGIARSFCVIECLEQLRRSSLDDYWKIVESWGKNPTERTLEETKLNAQIRVAARKLYSIRFSNIWKDNFSSLPFSARMIWKMLLNVELWKDISRQNYFLSLKSHGQDTILINVFFRSICRLNFILLEALLFLLKSYINKQRFSMHLLPISSMQLEDIILFGLSRNFNHSFQSNRFR